MELARIPIATAFVVDEEGDVNDEEMKNNNKKKEEDDCLQCGKGGSVLMTFTFVIYLFFFVFEILLALYLDGKVVGTERTSDQSALIASFIFLILCICLITFAYIHYTINTDPVVNTFCAITIGLAVIVFVILLLFLSLHHPYHSIDPHHVNFHHIFSPIYIALFFSFFLSSRIILNSLYKKSNKKEKDVVKQMTNNNNNTNNNINKIPMQNRNVWRYAGHAQQIVILFANGLMFCMLIVFVFFLATKLNNVFSNSLDSSSFSATSSWIYVFIPIFVMFALVFLFFSFSICVEEWCNTRWCYNEDVSNNSCFDTCLQLFLCGWYILPFVAFVAMLALRLDGDHSRSYLIIFSPLFTFTLLSGIVTPILAYGPCTSRR